MFYNIIWELKLRPLTIVQEIIQNLLEMYTIFGVPVVYHSDKSREYRNLIIECIPFIVISKFFTEKVSTTTGQAQ